MVARGGGGCLFRSGRCLSHARSRLDCLSNLGLEAHDGSLMTETQPLDCLLEEDLGDLQREILLSALQNLFECIVNQHSTIRCSYDGFT